MKFLTILATRPLQTIYIPQISDVYRPDPNKQETYFLKDLRFLNRSYFEKQHLDLSVGAKV